MYNLDMTLTKKKIFRNLIIVFLVLSIFYWTAVNVLVSAVLVPSFMERLESFERIARQSYAEQIQESDLQKNAAAMRVISSTLFTARRERRSSLTSTSAAFGNRFFSSR